jgi:hypothetical protein
MFQKTIFRTKEKGRTLHLTERPLFVLFVTPTFITNLQRKDAFMIVDY